MLQQASQGLNLPKQYTTGWEVARQDAGYRARKTAPQQELDRLQAHGKSD